MYARTYKCRSKYLMACFGDNGELLTIVLLKSLRKGLLTFVGYYDSWFLLTFFKKLRIEWEEIPYEPCLVALEDERQKILNLSWGFYQDKELSSRTRKRIVPFDGLMDFISEYLDSHKDYCVNLYSLWEIHGGATHHMTSQIETIIDNDFDRLVKTVKGYLSEILNNSWIFFLTI